MECRTCWCYLSPRLCWAPRLHRPGPSPAPHTHQILGSFSRLQGCFQEAISCRGRFFFPKEPKWGTSWCRLFMGNHCESSFTTHQQGLSLSRLHPALCPQPSFPGHARGVSFVTLTPLPQAPAGMPTCGRGSIQMVKMWTGVQAVQSLPGKVLHGLSLWWEKVWEKLRGDIRLHHTLAHQPLHSPTSLCCWV